jgi:O-acetyl-ADP-ribose deacetylase (regulator of RNase III)
MIQFKTGNILESNAQALVNTVNTVGVMGKGIALQFKNQFPHNFTEYVKACKSNSFQMGELLLVEDQSLHFGKKLIINFPTKTDWRKPSEYEYIETGLKKLVELIQTKKIHSIALPPLGAGNGGLDWERVKLLIVQYLSQLDCDVQVYEPSQQIVEIMRKERVALTPARAMLLAVFYDLVRHGEFVSEFAGEKIAYFLQRFGAQAHFKLQFEPNFYGPYSGKVRHVLFYLNGSYLAGFSDKNRKPFETLTLLTDAEPDVQAYLNRKEHAPERAIVDNTIAFLREFYSDFGLELLSTLDFIVAQNEGKADLPTIKNALKTWSARKSKLFDNERFLTIGLQKIAALPPQA